MKVEKLHGLAIGDYEARQHSQRDVDKAVEDEVSFVSPSQSGE